MDPGWYLRRLSRMGPREIMGRAVTTARKRRWRGVAASAPSRQVWLPRREFTAVLPDGIMAAVPADAAGRLIATADRLMDGHAEYFGVPRDDLVDPDWSLDPRTGRRAPTDGYAFDIPYRDEAIVGDINALLSRPCAGPRRHHAAEPAGRPAQQTRRASI